MKKQNPGFFCGEVCDLFAAHPLLALVTIVAGKGSAPRTPGARMLVLPGGGIRGSVGGGSYEAKSILASLELLTVEKKEAVTEKASGRAKGAVRGLLLDFSLQGVSDMDTVCGGSLRLLLEPLSALRQSALFTLAQEAEERGEAFTFLTRIHKEGPPSAGQAGMSPVLVERLLYLPGRGVFGGDGREHGDQGSGNTTFLPNAALCATRNFTRRTPALLDLEKERYLLEHFPRPHRVYVFGAGHIAQALASLAHTLDFWVTVLDDRPEFANQERFPLCRIEALTSLGRNDVTAFLAGCSLGVEDGIVIVTRGHAHDRDVLSAALGTQAGYIGMIGSKNKRAGVYASLRERGVTRKDLARVSSPIGVNIGAETPEEIAVSIAAELIQWRRGRLA